MIEVLLGSKNRAKLKAVEKGFATFAVDIQGLDVNSGVSSQPLTDEETRCGAVHRANECVKAGATLGVGLEGGIAQTDSGTLLCNWGALSDQNGNEVTASGARLFLPEEIAGEVRKGKELGKVIDTYASRKDVRQTEGAIGILTNGYVTRDEMYSHIVNLLIGQFQYYYQFSPTLRSRSEK